MKRGLSLILMLAGLPAIPAPATAQAVSALKGHNSNAPVDVEADRIEVQDRADRAIFSGNVKVKQTDLTLQANRLNVAYAGGTGGTQIQRLDASGNVIVTSPSERATGNFAIYDLNRKLITMLGNVNLVRGDSNVRGGRLVIDLTSGRATVDGSAVGGGAGISGGGGRVTGRFTVQQRPN
ncbi:LptA/OstA family protein [Sphingomonas solaris]|uniref:OstA family protein n=1 Tax=Alterirhizorhabdus solaris TaxID=2529389 RepID=A0A558QRY6_9SPHN|nr:LptA/OstA family protein [Sphingomonas solaris]TVV69911.1 OstA family protein [Sphingomonas solaris]